MIQQPLRRALGPAEQAALREAVEWYCLRGEDPGYQGHFEQLYCEEFCEMMGGGWADAVATGTAAVYCALAALQLPHGSEVLCSPISDPGSYSAVVMAGLRPRLCDSMPGSYNIGPEQVAERITRGCRALLVVHSCGKACDMPGLMRLAKQNGLKVVEDCSQAHAAFSGGQRVGTWGDIAAFSCMYRKAHWAGGSGGLVYSRQERLYQKAMAYADRGKPRWLPEFDDRDPRQFLWPALNLHTDEFSCAIGRASLRRLEQVRMQRLAFVAELQGLMRQKLNWMRTRMLYSPEDSPFIVPIEVSPHIGAVEVAEELRRAGIGCNPRYRYLASEWPWLQPYLAAAVEMPEARRSRDNSFVLYLNENYGEAEAAAIVRIMQAIEQRVAAGYSA